MVSAGAVLRVVLGRGRVVTGPAAARLAGRLPVKSVSWGRTPSANAATVVACRLDGLDLTLTVSVRTAAGAAEATAVAGPIRITDRAPVPGAVDAAGVAGPRRVTDRGPGSGRCSLSREAADRGDRLLRTASGV